MNKTLGGDRLGSGNKMKVEMHGYGRSNHDLGYVWRSTMAPGTLVPFMCNVGLPGDTWDIDLEAFFNTHPTIGPLFGSFKVQLDVFFAPVRLYNAHLHNNTLGIGMDMSRIKLPRLVMQALPSATPNDIDNSQVNPSSLLSYLGIRGIGRTAANRDREFNGVPVLAYWDIYKNYYANKQEEIGAVIHTPAEALIETVDAIKLISEVTGTQSLGTVPGLPILFDMTTVISTEYTGATPLADQIYIQTTDFGWKTMKELCTSVVDDGTALEGHYDFSRWGATSAVYWRYQDPTDINQGQPQISTFPLENIDKMRSEILAKQTFDAFKINDANVIPYKWLYEQPSGIPNVLSSQEGLGLKTYNSDMFNNWLKTEWLDDISSVTAVSTAGDEFTIDSLILARKVYDMMNRIAVSGGSYQDWQEATYAKQVSWQCTTPMYMGGLIKELVFQEVISNAESTEQPLGTLAGKGTLSGKHKGGKIVIHCDEIGYIIGIVSLTPRVDYSQGNNWDINLQTMNDFFKPALDEIGFQELIEEQMAWWTTTWDGVKWATRSAGKQPAWMNYMTAVNKNYGNFAITDNEMFMTLNRRYEWEGDDIKDLTTYIDPSKFNFIFAETSLDAQNFWAQIGVNAEVRRVKSARLMPNL